MNIANLLIILAAALINASGSAVMKYAASFKTAAVPNMTAYWMYLLLAMMLYGGCFPLFAIGLSRTRLSVAQPIFSAMSYVAVLAASLLFFHEPFAPLKAVGIAVIIVGMAMVVR